MERIADDGAALLDHLGIDRAVVGGCSMGGYAAFAFVRRHPQRLAGLVLQDTRAGADTAEAKANRAALAAKVLAEGAAAAVEAFLPKLLGATTHREQPELVARVRERILATPPRRSRARSTASPRALTRGRPCPRSACRRWCWWGRRTCSPRPPSPSASRPPSRRRAST